MKKLLLITFGGLFLTVNHIQAQCSFTGLNSTYCANDVPSTLVPSGGGYFAGPGITGNTFNPSLSGPGTHTINYIEGSGYVIDQTGTYALIPGTGTSVSLFDDEVSVLLPIGFSFSFFGNNYTNFQISSNGFLTFNNDFTSGCCSGQLIPQTATPNNLIAFSWDDMYPPGGATIEYFTTGVAPNQKLVVNFFNVDFCCSMGTPMVKTQIVLSETTNIIEVNTEYSNGVSPGTLGIENINGTIALAVPGRNSSAWPSLTNDYVAFIPSVVCSSTQTVLVNPLPVVDALVNLNPGCVGQTVTFTGSGANAYSWDNGVINGTPFTVVGPGIFTVIGTELLNGCTNTDFVNLTTVLSPTISITPQNEMFGNDGGISLTILSGIVPFTFDWSNDGLGDNNDNNDLGNVSAGTYTVIMTDGNGCSVTATATVGSQLGLTDLSGVNFSIQPNPSSGIFQIIFANEITDLSTKLEIVNVLGQKIITKKVESKMIDINITEHEAGVYYIKIITDKGISIKPIIIK